jgi:triosephosphate isomerase
MMRQKIVAGNWKMNMTEETAQALVLEIAAGYVQTPHANQIKTIVCPPYLLIPTCSGLLNQVSGMFMGAQNCHTEEKGAFTGEVSAAMLAGSGVQFVIVGHSERRMYFHEEAPMLSKKVRACLSNKLTPIFCCGELQSVRESGKYKELVGSQISDALFDLSVEEIGQLIIAYEPVWAIGTGLTASPAQAQEMHQFIRSIVAEKYGKTVADQLPILYGGSCNAANATELFSQPDVDGGLIGGASLKATDFLSIIRSAIETSKP